MKQMNYALTALLALAGTALLAPQARAQITVSNGDLILGIEDNTLGDQGYNQNYEVDLGNISQLSLTGVTNFGNIVSALDLGTIYGASFTGNSHISWSVVGQTAVNGTLGVTTPNALALSSTIGGVSTAYDGAKFVTSATAPTTYTTDRSLAVFTNPIKSLGLPGARSGGQPLPNSTASADTLAGATPYSANSPVAALFSGTDRNGGQNAYTYDENGDINTGFTLHSGVFFGAATGNGGVSGPATMGSGSSLGLYLLDPQSNSTLGDSNATTTTLLGTFSWVDNGDGVPDDLIFTGAQAAPEPTTWAMMLGGLGLLVWTLRRKQAAALV